MLEFNIEDYISRELSSAEQIVAMNFVHFLKDNHLSFYKDNGAYWKDKIYYWVKADDECVCFIAINNPDEEQNHWTIWSADMSSQWLGNDNTDSNIKKLLGSMLIVADIVALVVEEDIKSFLEKSLIMFVDVHLESIILNLKIYCFEENGENKNSRNKK